MEIVILLLLFSLAFAAGALGLFLWTLRQHTYEHADRLALLPLDPHDHD